MDHHNVESGGCRGVPASLSPRPHRSADAASRCDQAPVSVVSRSLIFRHSALMFAPSSGARPSQSFSGAAEINEITEPKKKRRGPIQAVNNREIQPAGTAHVENVYAKMMALFPYSSGTPGPRTGQRCV